MNAKAEGYSVVVSGFSLGGALATIAALKIVDGGIQTAENVSSAIASIPLGML